MHLFMSFLVFLTIFLLNIDEILSDAALSGPGLNSVMQNFQVRREALNKARKEFEAEKEEFENEKRIVEKFLKDSEVVEFNCGGEIMFTTRASILRISDSKMGKILLGLTTDKTSVDDQNRKFLDFNPSLCRHLLEQLRLFEDGEPIVFYPPLTTLQAVQFNAMLNKLGLKPAPESDDDIFTFNVGDEIISTKRRTLNRVPNSKLSSLLTMNKPADLDSNGRPFIDCDPNLFRHLLSQIQSGQITDFEAPSDESKAEFDAMLKQFELKPKA